MRDEYTLDTLLSIVAGGLAFLVVQGSVNPVLRTARSPLPVYAIEPTRTDEEFGLSSSGDKERDFFGREAHPPRYVSYADRQRFLHGQRRSA